MCAASRMADRPFSGSTPACAARPTSSRWKSAIPFRALTMSPLARAHSSTSATSCVRRRASRMTGVLNGEPISSSGLATKVTPGRAPASCSAATAWSPASSPAFMSVTPGPNARSPLDRYGRCGGRPRVEHGVHVADEEQPWPVAAQPSDDEVAELRPPSAGSWRWPLDIGAKLAQRIGHEVGDPVDAIGRVRAAVDVDEGLELGQEARQARVDDAPQRVEVGHGAQYTHGHAAGGRVSATTASSWSSCGCWMARIASSRARR